MPDIVRSPQRMICAGADLVSPLDRPSPGGFPYLQNVRVIEEGRLDSRPGYTPYDSVASPVNSVRRLNDPDDSSGPSGYINIVGAGTAVYGGIQGNLTSVDTGYSGNPLSLLQFRPDQAPETWMYIYDANKSAKVRPDKTVQPIGVPPPTFGSQATYGPPAAVDVDNGQLATSWAQSGSAGSPTLEDRVAKAMTVSSTLSISHILYDSGTAGWACIVPISGGGFATVLASGMGPRMKVILNTGAGNAETVIVREVHASAMGVSGTGSTTIAGIAYDAGSTGACTIVLAAQPDGGNYGALARNSVLEITSEFVRVLSVTLSPDGSTYSFRCVTTGSYAAGATITGYLSWYAYTTVTHASSETITASYVQSVNSTSSPSVATLTNTISGTLNCGVAANRPIDPANDWMHFSFYMDNIAALAFLELRIYVGAAATSDYYSWSITPDQMSSGWNEIIVPIAQATRFGNHLAQTLSNTTVLEILANCNGSCTIGFDWWYLFGTYGPEVAPNSPTGYLYDARYRVSDTGAASIPGPPIRYQLFPLREQVLITPKTTALVYIDTIDIYRAGSTLPTDANGAPIFVYAGTVPNTNSSPVAFSDNLPDSSLQGAPQADVTLLQPWPLLDLAWSGTVSVVGTRVTLVSGTAFKAALVSASVILINGVAYQTYGQPADSSHLEIFQSAGVQASATYSIASPLLAGQPLPFVFGPLEGPLAPVAFGLGDPINSGTLYYSNISNLDAASDQNTIEIAPPGEPLISGAVWNGLVFVGSRENVYVARYSYLQTLGVPGQTTFQFARIPSPSGMWSRWGCCAGQDGVYFIGRDGIYRATESGAENITDPRLYPLFPHDGQPGSITNGISPIDMGNLTGLRLTAADQDIYLDYTS